MNRLFRRRPLVLLNILVVGLSVFGLLASAVGCGSREEAPPDVVLYVTLTLGNPFYEEMISGLREGLLAQPTWRLDARAGQKPDDASGQRDIMESMLTSHLQKRVRIRGLILVPANSRSELVSTIKRYNDANVPVINVDIPIDTASLAQGGARVASFIGSNNIDGGAKAAEVMAGKLPQGGRILVLLGAPGSANTRDRLAGFREKIQAVGSTANVKYELREWTANWNMSEALTATDTILGGGTRIDGIFAENDLMALGAAQAIAAQAGMAQRPVVVGYDAIPDAVKAVKEGRIFATISQNPAAMGKLAIQYLERINKGEAVPGRTIITVTPVTK